MCENYETFSCVNDSQCYDSFQIGEFENLDSAYCPNSGKCCHNKNLKSGGGKEVNLGDKSCGVRNLDQKNDTKILVERVLNNNGIFQTTFGEGPHVCSLYTKLETRSVPSCVEQWGGGGGKVLSQGRVPRIGLHRSAHAHGQDPGLGPE